MSNASTIVRFGLALLAVAFLMPGHFLPWLAFQAQWVAACGMGLVALGAAWGAGASGAHVSWPPLAVLAAATALVPPLQWLAGQVTFHSDALLPALYLLAFALSVVAGAALAASDRTRWLDALFVALTVAAAVSVALALVQWTRLGVGGVWIADLPRGARPFANLGQANHLATLAGLGLLGCLRAYERRLLGAGATAVLAAWLLLGLVMAQSRTGWLFLLLLAIWWGALRGRVALRLAGGTVMAGLALFALAAVAWVPLNDALLLSVSNGLEERLQPGPRLLIWQQLIEAALRAPWFGFGWNQVTLAQQTVAADFPVVGRMFQNAHNVVLDLALWGGLPLALLWSAALAAWGVRRIRGCRDIDTWCGLAAVGAILLHAMLEYPLDHTYFLLPLGLVIGMLRRPASAAVSRGLPPGTLALPALVLMAMLVWIGAEYLRVEQATRDVRLMLAGVGLDRVPRVPPPQVVLLDGPREYHRFMITPARAGMDETELDWMRKVSQRNAFPPAMLRFALAAGLNGRPEEAALTLRRLCAMHPTERCDEGREAWRSAQQAFPVLAGVPGP